MSTEQDVVPKIFAFLVRYGHQRYCARCLSRAIGVQSVPAVERAMKALATDFGYRVEEWDCGQCPRRTLTIRALGTGM